MTTNEEPSFVGVIPAAGLGSRLGPLGYPKELLPIAFDGAAGSGLKPKPVMAYSLDAMRRAGVKDAVIVISELKFPIMQVFGGGEAVGLSLAYTVRRLPRGLADAVDAASPWLRGRGVCLALPDTILEPADSMSEVCALVRESGADLALGVFPTPIPEQLGPVRFSPEGAVLEVLDKPAHSPVKNTWAIAAWGPRFSALLCEANRAAAGQSAGPNLGELFQTAVQRGLDVRAKHFADGRFFDLGTTLGWGEYLRWSLHQESVPRHLSLAAAGGEFPGSYAS